MGRQGGDAASTMRSEESASVAAASSLSGATPLVLRGFSLSPFFVYASTLLFFPLLRFFFFLSTSLSFLLCLVGTILCVSRVVMWRQTRDTPPGHEATPSRSPTESQKRGVRGACPPACLSFFPHASAHPPTCRFVLFCDTRCFLLCWYVLCF